MNHQQGLAIALSKVCVCDFTDCVIVPIPGDKHDGGAAAINIQRRKLQKIQSDSQRVAEMPT